MRNRFPEVVTSLLEAADKRVKGPTPWIAIAVHHTGIGERDPKGITAEMWSKLAKGAATWLTAKDSNIVSAHFLIERDGSCVQMVDPDCEIAFHMGVSSGYHPVERKVMSNWNNYAIGIELAGDGDRHAFTEEQYFTLAKLCALCLERYKDIDPRCIRGHEDWSPGRKTDPGRNFNWRRFFVLLHLHIRELEESA